MKNLNLVNIELWKKDIDLKPEICCIVENLVYFIANSNLYVVTQNNVDHVAKLPTDDINTPVYFEECSSTHIILTCMPNGDLITFDTELKSPGELVGSVDPGALVGKWSPGGIQLAIVTSAYNVVLFSQDVEPLYECQLQDTDGESLVSVGWGKSETQFRGSAGKIKDETVQPVIAGYDDKKARLSWRGDGQLFAVSFFDEKRQIKVVNNEGKLLYNLEPTPGLESCLCWKPSGALIASTLQLPNKHIVCFFEKNLLRHGGFDLAENCVVKEILWNADSSVLALVTNESKIGLYTMSNYHWYRKFTINLPDDETALLVEWDENLSGCLNVISIDAESIKHRKWTWRAGVDCSSGASPDDQTWAAVIDANKVLMTAFKQAIIPPPMSLTSVSAEDPVNAVGFLQYGGENESTTSNDFFIQTSNNLIIFFKYDKASNTHKEVNRKSFSDYHLIQAAWVESNTLIVYSLDNSGQYKFDTVYLDDRESKSTRLDEALTFLKRYPGEHNLVLCKRDKTCITDFFGNEKSSFSCGVAVGVEVRKNKIFQLDTGHRLTVSGTPLATHVSSFCLTATHVLATTMKHKLHCWRLDALKEPPFERAIERGARMVTHITGSSSVVLQLPRGNLEVIQPRALTIAGLQALSDKAEFRSAYAIMRRERINLNLIYDHSPSNFENNINKFVRDVDDNTWLCTFIAELSNENVTRTLYSPFYQIPSETHQSKIETLCPLLLAEMTSSRHLLPRLSCLVKQGKLEEVLQLLKSLRDLELKGEKPEIPSSDGLAHVLYIVDVEELFKVALGTYDLPLVLFIASKSQKDPKEYVPFISNLQKMEENYRKFTIDNFLKRYKKALGHISLCSNRVKECLDYVVNHGLYKEALRVFHPGTDTWKSISVLYGQELTRLGRHEEAGVILRKAGELTIAQHAFGRAGNWKRQISCAIAQQISEEEKSKLFRSLAEYLRTSKRFTELARLSFDQINDTRAGVVALVAAGEFEEAIFEANSRGHNDLVDSVIRPGALTAADEMKNNFSNLVIEIDTNWQRLSELSKQSEENIQDWDDTSSESSRGSSRLSSRSSKNTRKLERNLMKRGGPFEKVALVAAIHDSCSRIVSLKIVVRNLNLTLVALSEDETARQLQESLATSLRRVQEVVKKVWNSNEEKPDTSHSAAAAFSFVRPQLPGPVQALQPKILFPPDLCIHVDWRLDVLETDE